MDIPQLFHPFPFTPNRKIVVAGLPETRRPHQLQLAGGDLFQHLNHDGKFDGPGESGYATGTLNSQGSGRVTVGGLVTGSYRVQAHFVDPSTGATLASNVRTVRLTPPPANSIPGTGVPRSSTGVWQWPQIASDTRYSPRFAGVDRSDDDSFRGGGRGRSRDWISSG